MPRVGQALIAVAGAAIVLISFKTGLVLRDLPLTVFVFLPSNTNDTRHIEEVRPCIAKNWTGSCPEGHLAASGTT
jgi:hypothetical protein